MPPLELQNITIIVPLELFEQRLSEAEGFSAVIKGVQAAVNAFDVAHPHTLPAELNAVVVTRASGSRVWLVGPAGDIEAPGLEADVAKLPLVSVKERQVAAAVHLMRKGATPDPKLRPIPVAWNSAMDPAGSQPDDVMDKVWPPGH